MHRHNMIRIFFAISEGQHLPSRIVLLLACNNQLSMYILRYSISDYILSESYHGMPVLFPEYPKIVLLIMERPPYLLGGQQIAGTRTKDKRYHHYFKGCLLC